MSTRFLEIGLIAALVMAVAAFGGTEPITWAIVQAALLLLGIFLLARPAKVSFGTSRLPLLGPAVLLLLVGLQWLGSFRGHLGFDFSAMQTEFVRLAAVLAAFYLSLAVCRRPEGRRHLVIALVGLGIFEALYGLVQYLAGWQFIFTYAKQFYREDATGTYINHNHYAGFLEMVLPLALALALEFGQELRPGRKANPAAAAIERLGQPALQKSLLLLFVASVFFLAIIFSQSRMGLVACVASLLVMAALLTLEKTHRATGALLILILLAAGAGIAAWIGVDSVVTRFEQLPQHELPSAGNPNRLALWRDASELVRANPFWGIGLGCFRFAYTPFQTLRIHAIVDHAHNDYLELAAELGIPGALLLFGMIFAVAGETLRASRTLRLRSGRILALGVFGGIFALLVHSLADFNLYIPANSLVFASLLGLGYAISAEPFAHGPAIPRPSET